MKKITSYAALYMVPIILLISGLIGKSSETLISTLIAAGIATGVAVLSHLFLKLLGEEPEPVPVKADKR